MSARATLGAPTPCDKRGLAEYEIDTFGSALALIKQDAFSGESAAYEAIPGSDAEVRAKVAEAEAFLARANWHVGVWEIRDAFLTVDLTIRPDGHYTAQNDTEFLEGTVRGRYTLAPGQIHFSPFVGQGLYARSNGEFGEFGKIARSRALDYYDGELQLIDLEAISQSVTIARKRPGSETLVLERAHQAQVEREREGWHLGIWEVQDPAGWMEFTFRPDHRYLAKSGTDGVPGPIRIQLTGPDAGHYAIRGTTEDAVNLVVERAGGLDAPVAWHTVQTNHVPGGPFVLHVPPDAQVAGYYRVREAVGSAND